jgi:hypothetical protein
MSSADDILEIKQFFPHEAFEVWPSRETLTVSIRSDRFRSIREPIQLEHNVPDKRRASSEETVTVRPAISRTAVIDGIVVLLERNTVCNFGDQITCS